MRAVEFMQLAMAEAQIAATQGEVPIGAVLVCDDTVITKAHNLCEATQDPTDHAEMQVIREVAASRKNWRLNDCALYVTIEPCPMCLGALFQARVGELVYAAADPKRAATQKTLSVFPSLKNIGELTDNNHTLKITGGVLEKECVAMMKDFFRMRRGGPMCPPVSDVHPPVSDVHPPVSDVHPPVSDAIRNGPTHGSAPTKKPT